MTPGEILIFLEDLAALQDRIEDEPDYTGQRGKESYLRALVSELRNELNTRSQTSMVPDIHAGELKETQRRLSEVFVNDSGAHACAQRARRGTGGGEGAGRACRKDQRRRADAAEKRIAATKAAVEKYKAECATAWRVENATAAERDAATLRASNAEANCERLGRELEATRAESDELRAGIQDHACQDSEAYEIAMNMIAQRNQRIADLEAALCRANTTTTRHVGSTLDSFLEEQGIKEECGTTTEVHVGPMPRPISDVIANIADLRGMLDRATPGPWKAGRMDMVSYTGDGQTAFKNIYVDDPRGGTHPAFGEPLPYTVARGEGDECLENAALIEAMHAALPALLEIVEATGDWFEGEGFDRLVPEFFANGSPGWKYRRIWQALARLKRA